MKALRLIVLFTTALVHVKLTATVANESLDVTLVTRIPTEETEAHSISGSEMETRTELIKSASTTEVELEDEANVTTKLEDETKVTTKFASTNEVSSSTTTEDPTSILERKVTVTRAKLTSRALRETTVKSTTDEIPVTSTTTAPTTIPERTLALASTSASVSAETKLRSFRQYFSSTSKGSLRLTSSALFQHHLNTDHDYKQGSSIDPGPPMMKLLKLMPEKRDRQTSTLKVGPPRPASGNHDLKFREHKADVKRTGPRVGGFKWDSRRRDFTVEDPGRRGSERRDSSVRDSTVGDSTMRTTKSSLAAENLTTVSSTSDGAESKWINEGYSSNNERMLLLCALTVQSLLGAIVTIFVIYYSCKGGIFGSRKAHTGQRPPASDAEKQNQNPPNMQNQNPPEEDPAQLSLPVFTGMERSEDEPPKL